MVDAVSASGPGEHESPAAHNLDVKRALEEYCRFPMPKASPLCSAADGAAERPISSSHS